MTTTLTPAATTGRHTPGLSAGRVLRSEWIKLWTLRSTYWTVGLAVAVMVGLTVLLAWADTVTADVDPDAGTAVVVGDAASLLSAGAFPAQVVIVVLGVLTISGEYSRGMIRSTLTAVPRRLPVLWGKVAALAAVTLTTGAIGVALSMVAAAPFYDTLNVTLDLSSADTLRMLAGVPLYLTGVALYAFALGALLRSSAAAMAIVLGQLLVLESVIGAIPVRAFEIVSPFLPGVAGQRLLMSAETLELMNAMSEGAHLTQWQGYAVLVAWVAVLFTAAAVRLRRRDA